MEKGAFFFQGVSLLLPGGAPANVENLEIPAIHGRDLPVLDTFTIPADDLGGPISGIVVSPESPLPSGWQAVPVRQIISSVATPHSSFLIPHPSFPRLLRAFHIAQWRRESVFCGSCGGKNTDASHDDDAPAPAHPAFIARRCPACGRLEFPRIAPAVIVLITNDEGKVLLAHNRKFDPGIYSLIAGFVEAGENLEAAAAREIREEVNIEVRDIQYITSQPWPFPNSLMAGFSARHASGTIKPDGVEIEDAQWFSRDNLPQLPGPGSVSRYLIEKWLGEKIRNEE